MGQERTRSTAEGNLVAAVSLRGLYAIQRGPYAGRYVNVTESGFRLTKNQGPWLPDRTKYLTIFLFGGSTAFGYGLPDGETVASYLQEFFSSCCPSRPARIYNFARGGYFSSQERVLLEKLIVAGFIPDMAVFIDGL